MGFNYAIADAANLRLKEKSTGNIVLSTPYANTTTAEFSSEQVYANAKGSRAVRFDYNKQGKLTCEFEVFDLKWISILLGGAWSTGVVDIAQKDVLSASATNTITLTGTPNASSLAIFKLQADNIGHDAEQTVGTPGTTPNTYSISGTTVTLNATTAPEGTKFVCYYLKDSAATAETLNIKTTEFPISYEIIGEESADLVKLEILVASEVVPGLTRIVSREEVEREGRKMVERLKDLLPKQQFVQALQAKSGGRIIARENIPALKKDVTGYLYGGDRTRKMKLWKKQARGKARLKSTGRVTLSADVFKELLKK